MKKLKCLTSAPARLSVAMPLIFGLATMAAAPTVEAVTVQSVNIINSRIDVNGDGLVNGADDLADVVLWFDNHTPARVDILNGFVDVDENGVREAVDDLFNSDWNDEIGGIPTTNRVDIINGFVDENENGNVSEAADAASRIQLFVLP